MPESNEPQESGKLFVGALAWNTTDKGLKDYFSKFGEVVDTVVMMDRVTLRSRGFGFVTFRDPECVDVVLSSRPHMLDDRKIDPKPCTPKAIQLQKRNAAIEHVQTHKVFVGGISKEANEDDVKAYFETFGPTTEVVFVLDKDDQKHKGFGFVTFQDAKSVDQVVNMQYHTILGKKVEAKRAQPRDKMLTGTVRPPHKQHIQPAPPNIPDGYGYSMPYGASQGPSGGWMPTHGGNPMMDFGYSGHPGQSYYGYEYPSYSQSSYGYGGPSMTDYEYPPSRSSSYGPAKCSYGDQSYYGNGNNNNTDSHPRKPGGSQGYHPYRR